MKETEQMQTCLWPALRLQEAVSTLALRAGLSPQKVDQLKLSGYFGQMDNESIDAWLQLTAKKFGLEIQAVDLEYQQLETRLANIAPAIIRVPGEEGLQFFLVLKSHRKKVTLLTPQRKTIKLPVAQLRHLLAEPLETPLTPALHTLLSEIGIPEERLYQTQQAILHEQLGTTSVTGCWILRLSPGDNFLKQVGYARIPQRLFTVLATSFAVQLLILVSWWLIGDNALAGHFQWTWVTAWALLLLSMVPFQILTVWVQNLLSLELGSLFKRRLLFGILQLKPEEIRHQGAGHFLGTVMEIVSLESLTTGGGMIALMAFIQLILATSVLLMGISGELLSLLLAIWIKFSLWLCWIYYRRSDQWNIAYLEITNDLVERMVGHRTRLAQENLENWHDEEDQLLKRYLDASVQLDHSNIWIKSLIEQGWFIVGLLGIAYASTYETFTTTDIAISLGGILLASQFLNLLVLGMTSLVSVAAAWKRIKTLFFAATRNHLKSSPQFISLGELKKRQRFEPVLKVNNLIFQYYPQSPPILHNCGLRIEKGERLLLEGTSGCGKSTLTSILTGLRDFESGKLRLWGIEQNLIDQQVWRQKIVTAPQFHENYVFTETFGFNLLMGRRWPPTFEDIQLAYEVCEELGLTDLLNRMPSGFQQMVGESGWQLSHGERSRLYIARTLLQQADLIILDESFAALDPENLKQALICVFKRAPTLLVVAHP